MLLKSAFFPKLLATMVLYAAIATTDAVADPLTPSARYEHNKLTVVPAGFTYKVRNGAGRRMSAARFADQAGDMETYRRARANGRFHTTMGLLALAATPVAFGLGVYYKESHEPAPLTSVLQYSWIAVGTLSFVLLVNRAPRRPPMYYSMDEAEKLAEKYNTELRAELHLSAETSQWYEPRSMPIEIAVNIAPNWAGVIGRF